MKDSLLELSAAFVGPVGSEGGRSPSTLSIGQAVPTGGLAPGQRWSVCCKREVVLRLLRIATIGDMANDLPMFSRSGLSIAMGNASEMVKARADRVTSSNAQEGFAAAVSMLLDPLS